jgi:hypothetical protein
MTSKTMNRFSPEICARAADRRQDSAGSTRRCATTIMVTGRIASRTNVTQFSMSDASGDEAARELHTGEDELTGHLTAPGLHPTLQGS